MMNRILIVAATQHEIQPLLDHYSIVVTGEGMYETMINERQQLNVLITGVGMVNTAFMLGRYSDELFDFVVNAGIAGSFKENIKIGDVVRIYSDELIEMGAEDGENFIRFPDLKLGGTNSYSEHCHLNTPELDKLPRVKGITVNKVHGREESIEITNKLFHPDIESMEGAAFFAGCARFNNYIQLRAISNKMEKRDREKWNIPLAIQHLNIFLIKLIDEFFRAH